MYVIGLDIGKFFVTVLICDKNGNVCSIRSSEYNLSRSAGHNINEHDPDSWWNASVEALRNALDDFQSQGHSAEEIICIAADGTSGTVFLADKNCRPLTNAILFDDVRARSEAEILNTVGKNYTEKLGVKFNERYGLPKILWLRNNMSNIYEETSYIMHPADYILYRLTGEKGISDYSTVLKSGYDIIDDTYSDCIENIGIDIEKFPKVNSPGSVIGVVCKNAAEQTGLSVKTMVACGSTDGYASCLCSGAVKPGRWATILGNTFVLKGVTDKLIKDSLGRIYCHKHPSGFYMPSGLSNAGGKCLEQEFGRENLKEFDASVLGLIPTSILVYPLSDTGERFPFVCDNAKKFVIGIGDVREMYTAHLEGLSYMERLAFETMEKLGCNIGDDVWAVGGSTKGNAWLKIRATVLKKNLHIPKVTIPAMGTAMLAASNTIYTSLEESSVSMLQEDRVVTPYEDFVFKYDRLYMQFKDKCSAIYSVDL